MAEALKSSGSSRGRRRLLLGALAISVLSVAIVAVEALAAAGGVDQAFSGDGRQTVGFTNAGNHDQAYGVAIQPNAKIVVTGDSVQNGTGRDFAVARLNPNGSLDGTFAGDGRRTFGFANGANSDHGRGVAIQPNGKIVVVGDSVQNGTGNDFAVARLNPNGGLDQSFSGDGKGTFDFGNGANSDSGYDVAIQPDGRIVVAGGSDQAGTGNDVAVARLNPNGGLDGTFSSDGRRTLGFANGANSDYGRDVAIQPNGKIVVAGASDQAGTGGDFAVARLNPNGGVDQSFSGAGRRTFGFANGANDDAGDDVGVQPNGKIVVAGVSDQGGTTGRDFAVARLNPNGSLDGTFAGDGRRTFGFLNAANSDTGRDVAIAPNGKIVVAGHSVQNATGTDFAVARLNPGGGIDASFSGDGRRTFGFANGANGDLGYDMAVQPDGRIVVVGYSYQGAITGDQFAIGRLLGA